MVQLPGRTQEVIVASNLRPILAPGNLSPLKAKAKRGTGHAQINLVVVELVGERAHGQGYVAPVEAIAQPKDGLPGPVGTTDADVRVAGHEPAVIQQHPTAGADDAVPRLEIIEIDAVWPGLVAPHLLDLTPYIGGDEAQFMAPLIANDTVRGRLVALPWFLDLGLLYFRQDLLDAAQIDIPGTWPALEAAATRLQDVQRATGEPRFWGFLWPGRQQEALTGAALEWIASWRGGVIVASSGQVTVDNPWAAHALARASGWMDLISPSSVLADTETDTLERFAAGNAAFMRLDCDLVPMEWSALIPGIEARTLNAAVASIAITDERRRRVDFTRPYYDTPARFVTRRGTIVGVESRDLAGKRIGVRRGTTFDRYVTDHYGGDVSVVRYSTQSSALLDLVLGRVDLVLANAAVLRASFLDTEHGADFGFVGPELRDPRCFGHGLGVAVGKRNTGLRTLLDRAIADIHVKGVFDRIARIWFEGQELRGPASRPDSD